LFFTLVLVQHSISVFVAKSVLPSDWTVHYSLLL